MYVVLSVIKENLQIASGTVHYDRLNDEIDKNLQMDFKFYRFYLYFVE